MGTIISFLYFAVLVFTVGLLVYVFVKKNVEKHNNLKQGVVEELAIVIDVKHEIGHFANGNKDYYYVVFQTDNDTIECKLNQQQYQQIENRKKGQFVHQGNIFIELK